MASLRREVLVVEPWFDGSHRAWAESLQAHSRHSITLLTREPAGRRAAFHEAAGVLGRRVTARPDVLVLSSMMDGPEFLATSDLAGVPTLLFLHENQLTYDRNRPDLDHGAVNWQTVLAVDRVAFNSTFHREDFFSALHLLGADQADIAAAGAKSLILPVGIEVPAGPRIDREAGDLPVILWNHRWEADKDPEAFVAAVTSVGDMPFQLILAGGGTRARDLAGRLVERFRDRVLHAGFAPPALYADLLRRSDLVVSTAKQEFFGVAVAEAMACGAVPLVPNRLAYPELLGPELDSCLYDAGSLADRLRSFLADTRLPVKLAPAAERAGRRFSWDRVVGAYDELIDAMA